MNRNRAFAQQVGQADARLYGDSTRLLFIERRSFIAGDGLPRSLGYISAEPQEPQVCCAFNVMSRLIPCPAVACLRSVDEALVRVCSSVAFDSQLIVDGF